MNLISTGCEPLDEILGGGLRCGEVTLVYGESGVGKTSLAIQCAFLSAKNCLKTIFIDSDNTFSLNRLGHIAGNKIHQVLPLIFVFKPQNFQEQSLLMENLESYKIHSIALIVVDTVTTLYSVEMDSTEKVFALSMELNRQLAYLNEFARSYNTAILLTSQVHSVVQRRLSEKKIEPIAHRVLKFWAQKIMYLESTAESPVKKAKLEKKRSGIKDEITCFYLLSEKGIVNTK